MNKKIKYIEEIYLNEETNECQLILIDVDRDEDSNGLESKMLRTSVGYNFSLSVRRYLDKNYKEVKKGKINNGNKRH